MLYIMLRKKWTLQRYLIKKILVAILVQYCEDHITYTDLMHTWITNECPHWNKNSKMTNRRPLRQQFSTQGRAMSRNCTNNLLLGSDVGSVSKVNPPKIATLASVEAQKLLSQSFWNPVTSCHESQTQLDDGKQAMRGKKSLSVACSSPIMVSQIAYQRNNLI